MDKPILDDKTRKDLAESFKVLKAPVKLMLLTREGPNDKYNEIATRLVTEVTSLSSLLEAQFEDIGGAASDKYGVARSPSLLISPDKFNIRFTGTPLGEEGSTLIMSLILSSSDKKVLKPESMDALAKLREDRHVQVYVSPT